MDKNLKALRIDRDKKRQRKSGHLKIVLPFLVLIVALLILALTLDWNPIGQGIAADSEPAEQIAQDESPDASEDPPGREVLIASGYVVAHHRHALGSKVTGKIIWIGVEKGDKVRKEDLLVKLDDREFRAQVEQARGDFENAKARLAELEAGSRPQEIARAEAQLERAKADASYAKLDWERLAALLDDSGVVSQHEVDSSRSRYDVATAAVRVAEEDLQLMRLGPRIEQIEQARAQMSRAQGNLDYTLALLDATEIRAPVDGTILQRIAEVGEMLTTSFAGSAGAKSAVLAIADLNDIQVELDISQADFKKISKTQVCRMVPEAYPDRTYSCEIAEIAPEADRQKATIQVKVQILEPDDYLRPDMDARVTFLRPESEDDSSTGPAAEDPTEKE